MKSKCAQLLLINNINVFWLSTITRVLDTLKKACYTSKPCVLCKRLAVCDSGLYLWSGRGLGLKGLFWLLNFCFCFSYYLTGLFWSGVWVSLVSSKTFLHKYSLVRSCSSWYLVNEWYIWFFKGFDFVCLHCFPLALTSSIVLM